MFSNALRLTPRLRTADLGAAGLLPLVSNSERKKCFYCLLSVLCFPVEPTVKFRAVLKTLLTLESLGWVCENSPAWGPAYGLPSCSGKFFAKSLALLEDVVNHPASSEQEELLIPFCLRWREPPSGSKRFLQHLVELVLAFSACLFLTVSWPTTLIKISPKPEISGILST